MGVGHNLELVPTHLLLPWMGSSTLEEEWVAVPENRDL